MLYIYILWSPFIHNGWVYIDAMSISQAFPMCFGTQPQLSWKGFPYKVCGCYLVHLSCSNFYQLDSQNKTWVTLSNLRWRINKNQVAVWTSLHLAMDSGSACLLISYMNRYVLPNVLSIQHGQANKIWRHSPIFVLCVVFIVFAHWSSPRHTPIKYICRVKKKVSNNTRIP